MAVVTNYLINLIIKQVEQHGVVVWYDPDRAYEDAVAELEQRATGDPPFSVARYQGSFFQLRRAVDHLLNGEEPPRLVVYVPVAQAESHHALIELEAAGVVVQPGQQPPARNTRLSIVARRALKGVIGDEAAGDVEKQVEAGKLTLADLNALAQKGGEIASGVVSLIFGTGNPQEVALAFLDSDRFDKEIEKKSAERELYQLLCPIFDFNGPHTHNGPQINTDKHRSENFEEASGSTRVHPGLNAFREKLARHVLMTELIHGLGEAVPPSLRSVPVAQSKAGVDSCVRLAKTWRQLRDYRDSYLAAAERCESSLAGCPWQDSVDALLRHGGELQADLVPETILPLEHALLAVVANRLLEEPGPALLELARQRLAGFWAGSMPDIQAHWALLIAAGNVLLEADRVERELEDFLRNRQERTTDHGQLTRLIKAYTEGDSPWCLLDTHHRHMETRWSNVDPNDEQDGLEKLVVKARQRYMEVASQLARHFVTALAKANPPLQDVRRQRDIYDSLVKPHLDEAKTAYIWVDALRYEMARELCGVLKKNFEIELIPATATPPTITEIGMAALLPGASDAQVVSVGGGKLAVKIRGTVIKDRKDRVNFLTEHAGVGVFEAKLDDLLPKPAKKVREGIKSAQLVLITSQEIDELCEKDNIMQARRQMDGVLNDLQRGVRVLADLGVQAIVLCADHGHLFAEEITDDMKIDAPGGDTADLHRRVWVGVGGTAEPSYLRAPLSSLGVPSEFDIATPYTLACFKAKGGGRAYFHGGLSPQELIIPVMTMRPKRQTAAGLPTGIQWALATGSPKLTTRFVSVQITGKEKASPSLFEFELPKVRVEVRAKGKCVSRPVSASYGFEDATGEVQMRVREDDRTTIEPNTVTVMIVEEISQKTVSMVLLDASTGAELARLDKIENAISI